MTFNATFSSLCQNNCSNNPFEYYKNDNIAVFNSHDNLLIMVVANWLEAAGSITGYSTDLYLARQPNIGSTTPGTLDNVRIYNRAISEKEVMELYLEDF